MKPLVLYLVRHGAIISVAGKVFIGQTEAPLSEEGVEQAWALRKWLDAVRFSRVISSDLSRSQRTSKIIAGCCSTPLEAMPALREINLGDWEGISFDEIRERFPQEYEARGRDIENWRPPHGESFADCRARVYSALEDILMSSHGNILLVGHAGVNRLILCSVLGIPVKNLHRIGQDYGCVNIIEFAPHRARVQLINYTPLRAQPAESVSSQARMPRNEDIPEAAWSR